MKNYDKLVSKILSEVVGPNAPSNDSLPTPNKDYKWPSGEITPEMLQDIEKRANTPKAIRDITIDLVMHVNNFFENDQYWGPFIERLLREEKSEDLKQLLSTVSTKRLKSLSRLLLLTGKSIFIKKGENKNADSIDTLLNVLMKIFPINEEKDRCYRKAVQAYGKKTSAYRSAAMVKCRKGKIWKKK
jgi:hypothetical protein